MTTEFPHVPAAESFVRAPRPGKHTVNHTGSPTGKFSGGHSGSHSGNHVPHAPHTAHVPPTARAAQANHATHAAHGGRGAHGGNGVQARGLHSHGGNVAPSTHAPSEGRGGASHYAPSEGRGAHTAPGSRPRHGAGPSRNGPARNGNRRSPTADKGRPQWAGSRDRPAVVAFDAPATGPFAELGLCAPLVHALGTSGYTEPTPVQVQSIPAVLAGADLMVSSGTGSGKTAAFVLPVLQRMAMNDATGVPGTVGGTGHSGASAGPRLLVLAPTRELAQQVAKAAETYGAHLKRLTVATVLGGVPYVQQVRALRDPLDVLIATPGRLLDLLRSGRVTLNRVETLVLDEADRMLDMGFVDDIRAIAAATPAGRQTLLFSATLGGDVGRLGAGLLRSPRRIELQTETGPSAAITQRLHWADNFHHKQALLDRLLADPAIDQAIVFVSTQVDAERIAELLQAGGHAVAALHGGMPQGARTRTLSNLRLRRLRVLVATDVAARGIDVPTISHVINYGLPLKPEDYVHRIGRTGRAGRTGMAVTLADSHHMGQLRRIERFTGRPIEATTLEGLEPTRRPSSRPMSRPGNGSGRPGGRPTSAPSRRPR